MPGSYSLGPYDGLKRTGIRLWGEAGPWAPRRSAAMDFALRFNDRIPRPTGWDWAAESPEFPAPGPLIRGVYRRAALPTPTVAQERAQIPGKGEDE